MKGSIERLNSIEKMSTDGTFERMTKKEVIGLTREREKLEKALGGIKDMGELPGAVFIVDVVKEHIAVSEARKLEIPIVAVVDTNCDPDVIDYAIPGNDDAIRSIKLFASKVAEACLLGQKLQRERATQSRNQPEGEGAEAPTIRVSSGGEGPRVEVVVSPAQRAADPRGGGHARGRGQGIAGRAAGLVESLFERHGHGNQREDDPGPARAYRRGFSDCKKALVETGADMDKAVDFLRKKGIAAAAKKAVRVASQGVVVSYLHGSRIGVLLEVNCETDFVARNEAFVEFAKDVAMQVAAMNPQYVPRTRSPPSVIEKEKAIRLEQAKTSGKPEAVWPKIIEGQIAKWFKEVCLLDQVWMKDPDGKKDIRSLQTELVAKTGENVKIRRFVRYEVGEGLEKRSDDFVEEVKRQAGQA